GFPEVYRVQVSPPDSPDVVWVAWDSPVPRPQQQNRTHLHLVDHPVVGPDGAAVALVRCQYRMHAFNKLQRDEAQRQAVYWVVGIVVFGGSALALLWVYLFL